jgi:hypothetical protein
MIRFNSDRPTAEAMRSEVCFRGSAPTLLWVRRQRGGWCPLRRHRRGLARGGSGGTEGRRRGDPRKNFLVGGLQPSHLTPNLFLSGSEPPNGLPQLVEALRHLLRLLRVEGGGGWRRRDRLWRGLRNRCRFLGLLHRRPSSSVFGTDQRLRPVRDRLPDLRRPAELRGPCGDYLLGILAISLPSQGTSDTNANRDQVTNKCSQGRCLKGSSDPSG